MIWHPDRMILDLRHYKTGALAIFECPSEGHRDGHAVECARCATLNGWKKRQPTKCRHCGLKFEFSCDRFDVDVWNHEGEVVRHLRDVTWDEAEEIQDEYSDDPLLTVVVEQRS